MTNDLDIPATGSDGPLSSVQYINTAGTILCNMCDWRWLDGLSDTLDLTANAYVNLPDNLRGIHAITLAALGERITLVDFETFQQYQKNTLQPTGYVGYIGGTRDANGGFKHRLFIYPASTGAVSDAVMIVYKGGWQAIADNALGSTKMGIPDFMDGLFLEVLRAVVHGYEEDANAGVAPRVDAVKASSIYRDAVAVDVNMAPYAFPIPRFSLPSSYEPNHVYNDLPTMS
ncbi:MAG: hypothetical protein ACX94C_07720 [Phycisphaerales bacterium]